MVDDLRADLTATLKGAGSLFERLAAGITTPELTNNQALEAGDLCGLAGEAILSAVSAGLLNVPAIVAVAARHFVREGEDPEGWRPEPVFLDTMDAFLYRETARRFPPSAHHFPPIGQYQRADHIELRRQNVQQMAQGCRLLAELVETTGGSEYQSPADFAKVCAMFRDALLTFRQFQETPPGNAQEPLEAEQALEETSYPIRSYFQGKFPPEINQSWKDFTEGTTDGPQRALAAADQLLAWVSSLLAPLQQDEDTENT
jgi:hypothetical protein